MTPGDRGTGAAAPSGFTMSFSTVALLTYILSTCVVLWVWGVSFRTIKAYFGVGFRDFVLRSGEKLRRMRNFMQWRRKRKGAESDQEA